MRLSLHPHPSQTHLTIILKQTSDEKKDTSLNAICLSGVGLMSIRLSDGSFTTLDLAEEAAQFCRNVPALPLSTGVSSDCGYNAVTHAGPAAQRVADGPPQRAYLKDQAACAQQVHM